MIYLSLKIIRLANNDNTFTAVVPLKVVSKAVERNKLKRRARHIFRKMLPEIKKGLGIIIFFKPGSEKLKFQELEEEIKVIFKKAKILQ
jgi:ribonuclease P protein component